MSASNEQSPLLLSVEQQQEFLEQDDDQDEEESSDQLHENDPNQSIRCSKKIGRCLVDTYVDNKFVIHIALAIGLAKLYPPLGAVYVQPQITATWLAVIFIFTMAGLSLKSSELTKAMTRMKFNFFVQIFNFGIVSLFVFGISRLLLYWNLIASGLADGMVICSCMPITVTMVIVLTKSANGDEAAAILNAAFGSLLGVFVSPLLMLSYVGVKADIDMASVFIKLCLRVLVPIIVGQILQRYSTRVVEFVKNHKKNFKTCQEWALVFIVYTAFCKTFASSQPLGVHWTNIIVMAIAQVFCLLVCMWLAWITLKALYRNEPKLRVMGLYGCTQKSVAMGIPLLNAIYENDPHLGLYTLPLLIWHPATLMIGSSLAPKLAEGVDQLEQYMSLSASTRQNRQRVSFFQRPQPMKRESFVAFEVE